MNAYAFDITKPNSTKLLTTASYVLLATLFSLSSSGCSKRYVCGSKVYDSMPSKIISLSTIAFNDTTSAYISGFIVGAFTENNIKQSYCLIYSNVVIKNIDSRQEVIFTTDFDGKYEGYLPPGEYSINFSYTGFNPLRVEKLKFFPREAKYLAVSLGRAGVNYKTYTY